MIAYIQSHLSHLPRRKNKKIYINIFATKMRKGQSFCWLPLRGETILITLIMLGNKRCDLIPLKSGTVGKYFTDSKSKVSSTHTFV